MRMHPVPIHILLLLIIYLLQSHNRNSPKYDGMLLEQVSLIT